MLTGNLRLLSSAFDGDGSASSLIDPPTGGGGLQCSLYLFSTFGCSQTDFTLLAIRFSFVSFRVCWFAGLRVCPFYLLVAVTIRFGFAVYTPRIL